MPIIKKIGARLIAVVGNTKSTLAKNADFTLDVSVKKEACSLGLAPTAAVYVGDDWERDVEGARGAGLHAVDVGGLATLAALPNHLASLDRAESESSRGREPPKPESRGASSRDE